jgi:ferrous iron transport protein A
MHPPSYQLQSIPPSNHTLLDLKPGERATFLGVHGGQNVWGRLIAMGFTPGVEVEMMQNHRRGPLLVAVRGTFVALGRGEAGRVLIELKRP